MLLKEIAGKLKVGDVLWLKYEVNGHPNSYRLAFRRMASIPVLG